MKCITKLEEFMKYNMVEQLSDPDPAKWGIYITDKFSNALSKGRQAA
jgi:hypothetical protein